MHTPVNIRNNDIKLSNINDLQSNFIAGYALSICMPTSSILGAKKFYFYRIHCSILSRFKDKIIVSTFKVYSPQLFARNLEQYPFHVFYFCLIFGYNNKLRIYKSIDFEKTINIPGVQGQPMLPGWSNYELFTRRLRLTCPKNVVLTLHYFHKGSQL